MKRAERLELATAILKAATKHKVKDHYWANGMHHDAFVCVYCDWWENPFRKQNEHAKDCPYHKAKAIVDEINAAL